MASKNIKKIIKVYLGESQGATTIQIMYTSKKIVSSFEYLSHLKPPKKNSCCNNYLRKYGTYHYTVLILKYWFFSNQTFLISNQCHKLKNLLGNIHKWLPKLFRHFWPNYLVLYFLTFDNPKNGHHGCYICTFTCAHHVNLTLTT